MLLVTILKVALKSLMANRLRTVLAMLGIVIGVSSVIAMLAIGAGAQTSIMGRINSMGSNLLIVRSGQANQRGVATGINQQTLKVADAEAILASVGGVSAVTPVVQGSVQAKYLNRNSRITMTGGSPTYFKIRNFEIGQGRSFTDREVDSLARVTVIGPTTANDLFGKANPIGQVIKLDGRSFRIIGVTKSKGDQGWFSPDDAAYIPYSTAMALMLGVDYLREIDVELIDGADSATAVTGITQMLRRRHHLSADAENDFNISDQADILKTASTVSSSIKLLLGAIAAISLVVGGIGIMNIMLVTVTERTREIGIRKAIGARRRDIMVQFLVESMALSGIGGVIGILIGASLVLFVNHFFGTTGVIETSAVLLSTGFSFATGIFFGIYPARRAAALDPIECLRYE
ncbi:FtsX-like permease family protein [bacterium]|nr:FtsX-like permease family protein [bacterium]